MEFKHYLRIFSVEKIDFFFVVKFYSITLWLWKRWKSI